LLCASLLQLDGKMKMGTRMLSPTSIADLMDGTGGIGSNGSVNIFSTKNNNNNNNNSLHSMNNKGPNKRRAGSEEDMDEGMLSVEAGVEALRASKAIKVRHHNLCIYSILFLPSISKQLYMHNAAVSSLCIVC
jgi:hypothetical protein